MNKDQKPASLSVIPKPAMPGHAAPDPVAPDAAWPPMPVETEVYILPDGQVVIADLPAELAEHLGRWGSPAVAPSPSPVTGDPVQPNSVDCAGDSG
jgi:hypothetical protein